MFDRFLGITHKWFAGGKLTFVDFIINDALDQLCLFDEKPLVPYDNLKHFTITQFWRVFFIIELTWFISNVK